MRAKSVWFAGWIGMLLLLSACGSQPQQQNAPAAPETAEEKENVLAVKMGTQPWIGYGPWSIAEEKGIFEKCGLDVTLVTFQQDADINAALASGNIDVANIATHTAIKMIGNNGLDLLGIVFLDESTKADAVLAPKEITDIAQLKGKKVAFEEGTTSELLLRQALSEKDIAPEELEFVHMPASDAGLALVAKKVDAAVTYEPYITTVMEKGKDEGIHILYSGENAPGLISDILVVKADSLDKNPDLKDKLQKAWDEALAYWKEHPEEGNEIVAKNSGISSEELPPILEGLKFYSIEEQKGKAGSGDLLKAADNVQNILLEQQGLKGEIDLQKFLQIE